MKREIAIVGMIVCIAGGFLAGWLIPPLFTTDTSTSALDRIQSEGTIRIGTSSDWPPFEIFNTTTNEYEGFDIELCEIIAADLGVNIQWEDMDFGDLIDSCLTGLIDMIAAAMFVTPTRAEQLAHSVPYIRTNMVVMVLENSTIEIEGLDDLADYENGVQTGTAEMWELDDMGIDYNDYPRADLIIQNLLLGIIDIAFVDEPVFTHWSKTYDLKVIYTVLAEPCAFFCRWDEPELLSAINDAILESYTDGTLDALIEKWFS